MFLIRLDFTINGIDAVVFNIDGQYYAMSNTCIHRGALLVRDYYNFWQYCRYHT